MSNLLDFLPDETEPTNLDPVDLIYLVVAPPKWGKTTFAMDFPDSVLLAFEEGHLFQAGSKIVITCWDYPRGKSKPPEKEDGITYCSAIQAVEMMELTDKFDFIIVDTTDMAAKMCLDYYLIRANAEHASDMGDYGKGYDVAQNTPFRRFVNRLIKSGRGVAFITHSQVNTREAKNFSKGEIATSLPTGIFKIVHTQADIILHGFLGKDSGKGYRDRIIYTQGDEDVLAGNRVQNIFIPPRYIVDSESPFEQWEKFFSDEKFAEKTYEEYLKKYKTRSKQEENK